MQLSFRQGIIRYPTALGQQAFLQSVGSTVNLIATNNIVLLTFAHGPANYLFAETQDTTAAWSGLPSGVDVWLFWDIDPLTGVRTFGHTTLQPLVSSTTPLSPADGQMWFRPSIATMHVATGGRFRPAIRVLAAKYNSGLFAPVGVGVTGLPFAGTQVGLNVTAEAGYLVFEDTGRPLRRANNTFFTSDDVFVVEGGPVNSVTLEGAVIHARSLANVARFSVVKFSDLDEATPATYNDIQTGTIAILHEDAILGDVVGMTIQGVVQNPAWTWTAPVPLWVDDSGQLTEVDLHVTAPLSHPTQKPPVARVINQTTIMFDQGLGGIGLIQAASSPTSVPLASSTVYGITKLSLEAVDPANPIAVGDNDIRLTNKVLRAGDTMTGFLVLHADPTDPLHAATKQYVDTGLATKLNLTGGVLTGSLTLDADPITSLEAATKQYVDASVIRDVTIAGSGNGSPPAGARVLMFNVVQPTTFSAVGAIARVETVATASTVFDIQHNGASIGTMTFAAGINTGTVVLPATNFASGDRLHVIAPGSADATLADLSFSFAGTLL